MVHPTHPTLANFTFDSLVTEVDTIVEDLRWLHLELHLRNRLNETLVLENRSVDEFLALSLHDLRDKLGAHELTVLVRRRGGARIGFRDADVTAMWTDDHLPWMDVGLRWFRHPSRSVTGLHAEVNHYSVDGKAVTSIVVPVLVRRRCDAVFVLIAPSSGAIPRLRKLLTGLSGALGVSIDYLQRRAHPPVEPTDGQDLREPPPPEPGADGAGSGDTAAAFTLDNLRSPMLVLLDEDLNVVHVNDRFVEETGFPAAALRDRPLRTVFAASEDHLALAMHLESLLQAAATGFHVDFGLLTGSGNVVPTSWHAAVVRDGDGRVVLALLGECIAHSNILRRGTDASGGSGRNERLAKNYRFMMKYVPFPIVHIGEHDDGIRNANPAFSAIIGTREWEGVPLGDFATLDIHDGVGQTLACTLHVLSAAGLTLAYRGIVSTLELYGKVVREIKLDPID